MSMIVTHLQSMKKYMAKRRKPSKIGQDQETDFCFRVSFDRYCQNLNFGREAGH